jgi:sodium transport system ATP-binding protein
MREAERLCDRVAIMHRGKILAEGAVVNMKHEYGGGDLEEAFFTLIREQESLIPSLQEKGM